MKTGLFVIGLLLVLLAVACGRAGPTPESATAAPPSVAPATLPPTLGDTAVSAALPSATLPSPSNIPISEATLTPSATLTMTPFPTPLPTIGPASVMIARRDLRPMAYVPAGPFWMGASDADTNTDWDERPRHQVELDAFWIDIYEVTHLDYQTCVSAGACDAPVELDYNGHSYAFAAQIEDGAVVNVTWYNAGDYCAWAGKRLPTEAEWEKAAHGEDSRIYPWGDDADALGRAWFGGVYSADNPNVYDDFSRPAPVGSFPDGASPYGLFDMAGNVWEWVQDWYASDTYAEPGQVNPTGPEAGSYRVIRGGAWTSLATTELRTTYRLARSPVTAWIDVGFRCVMEDAPDAAGQYAGLLYPGQPTETPTLTSTPVLPTALPENLPLYALTFAGSDGRIYVVNSDGSGLTAITDGTVTYSSPAWSPAADTIAASASGDLNPAIWLMAPDGSQLRQLFELPTGVQQSYGCVSSLQWSPDGTHLAFQSFTVMDTYYTPNVHVVDRSGSGFVSQAYAFGFSWLLSSDQVAFVSFNRDLNEFSIVRAPVGLSREGYVTLAGGMIGTWLQPDWSPDGRNVVYAFAENPDAPSDSLVIVSVDSGLPQQIYPAPGEEASVLHPTWSPTGDEIAFVSGGVLYAIRPDGTGLRVIMAELPGRRVDGLSWSPDGTRLAMSTSDLKLYVVNADGTGQVMVALGLEFAGCAVAGFDASGEVDWSIDLNSPPQWSPWPVAP